MFDFVRDSGSLFAIKFAEDYSAFQIGFADAVEFLPDGLAGIQGNAVVGTPSVDAPVEFRGAVEQRGAATPQVQTEEGINGRHDGALSALPEVIVILRPAVVAVSNDDGDHVVLPFFGRQAARSFGKVSVQDFVLVRPLREADGIAEVELQPLLDVSFHLDVNLNILHGKNGRGVRDKECARARTRKRLGNYICLH